MCNRERHLRILCLLVSPLSTPPLNFRESYLNELDSERAFFSLTSWYRSGFQFLQIGIRAIYFLQIDIRAIYFLQIGIRADDEHDGTNAATTTDEDELRELEHPNESSSRFARRMGGGQRRF